MKKVFLGEMVVHFFYWGISVAFIVGMFEPFGRQAQAQHFTDCVTSAESATIALPDTLQSALGNGAELETGDEVAVFTVGGECAGHGIWSGVSLAIPAAGKLSPGESGFGPGEKLKFKVWDTSRQVEVLVDEVVYVSCAESNLCRDDGRYRAGSVLMLAQLGVKIDEVIRSGAIRDAEVAVSVKGTIARLQWKRSTWANCVEFEVQHQRVEESDWHRMDVMDGPNTTIASSFFTYRTHSLSPGVHRFRIKGVKKDGTARLSAPVDVQIQLSTAYELEAPHPNPFQSTISFSLMLAQSQPVRIVVYNVLGQRVKLLHDSRLAADRTHTFEIDGRALLSGAYFLHVRGDTFETTRKIMHIR